MTYLNIEATEVDSLIAKGGVDILDMRDLNSFNGGHIPNAKPANDIILEKLIKNKNKEEPVLVYCYLGNSSKDLSTLLTKVGFKQVYNLVGGFTAWKKQQLKQTQETTNPESQWLIDKGLDPDKLNDRTTNGNTALMEAAKDGNTTMLNLLLERGADADLVNNDENIALWFACFSNQLELVKTLIYYTGNLNHQNVNGATCLSYAASSGKLDIVIALVEAGADPTIETHDGFSAVELSSTAPILKYLRSSTSLKTSVV